MIFNQTSSKYIGAIFKERFKILGMFFDEKTLHRIFKFVDNKYQKEYLVKLNDEENIISYLTNIVKIDIREEKIDKILE